MSQDTIKSEDYIEPVCPLCMVPDGKQIKRIPSARVIEKLDEYLAHNDLAGAARHLDYWYREAKENRDWQGLLTVVNECIGLYRKTEKKEETMGYVKEAEELLRMANLTDSLSAGTTYLNIGTAMSAFGEPERALRAYDQAQVLYDHYLRPDDTRRAGLQNNRAIPLMRLGRFEEALACYKEALRILEAEEGTEPDRAITYLNLADLYSAMEKDEAEITFCLTKAQALLDDPNVKHDGYFAYVCDKCAPTYGYYGWFLYEIALKKRAKEIYEGH